MAVRRAFADATPVSLTQAWLDSPEPGLAPGVVRAGWRDGSLLVFAELTDHDVFTHAQAHNQRFWELGDTFEMFLQPSAGQPYVELHVAPNNCRLQLRFDAPPSGADPFIAALIHDDTFTSSSWIEAGSNAWCVCAEIPDPVGGARLRHPSAGVELALLLQPV